jgi:hypothetical protein
MQKDSRVKLTLNERNLGASSTFQKNCHLCRGEFIAPSDHDDFWLPEKIGLMVAYFSEHPETELVFTDSVITNMDFSKKMGSLQNKFGNSSQGEPVSINALLERNLVPFHASMFRQTLTRKIVPIPEGLMHDIWTALVCSLKSPLGYINQGLDLYRQHEKNMVGVSTRSTVFYSKRLNDLGFLQEHYKVKLELLTIYKKLSTFEGSAAAQKALNEKITNQTVLLDVMRSSSFGEFVRRLIRAAWTILNTSQKYHFKQCLFLAFSWGAIRKLKLDSKAG